MTTDLYVPPPFRFTKQTPALIPVILRAFRAGAVLSLDWASLTYIEHAPAYVVLGIAIDSALILGVLESRDWLAFKGRYYFRTSLAVLMVAYL